MLRAFCVWGVFWMRFAYGLPQSLSESFFDVRSEDKPDFDDFFGNGCFPNLATQTLVECSNEQWLDTIEENCDVRPRAKSCCCSG